MKKYLDRLEILDEENINDIVKLKVIEIEGYNYKLEKENGDIIDKNIEIYGDINIQINDYIYMTESTLKEENMLQYGPVNNSKNELIKIVNVNQEYYLQRYYG